MNKNKILVTGGHGLLGTAMKNLLPPNQNVFYPTKQELNLLNRDKTIEYFNDHNFDYVMHFAARVGGVLDNLKHPADFFTENLRMNTNVLEACTKTNVKKLLSVLSTCIYPDEKYVSYPLTEDQLHIGPPHEGNFGYAYSKRMMDVLCKAYRKQHSSNFINVIPNNMFGPGDNFHYDNSHVIPAIIRKIWEAKIQNKSNVEIWGSGKPLREFTYSYDIAKICLMLLETYDKEEPLNIGNSKEYSIQHIAEKVKTILEYDGELKFNTLKPDGQFRKPSSNKNFLKQTKWTETEYTPLNQALKETCDWFKKTYPNIRGVE